MSSSKFWHKLRALAIALWGGIWEAMLEQRKMKPKSHIDILSQISVGEKYLSDGFGAMINTAILIFYH
jgi:hypothetical protein